MMPHYDIIVIGSGPGGYTAAIRAAQLGRRVAIVERAELGGVCLNWGCIPSKALIKSAQVFHYARNLASYGVDLQGEVAANMVTMVERSRGVAAQMGKGVEFLMGKNKIDVIRGSGTLRPGGIVEVAAGAGAESVPAIAEVAGGGTTDAENVPARVEPSTACGCASSPTVAGSSAEGWRRIAQGGNSAPRLVGRSPQPAEAGATNGTRGENVTQLTASHIILATGASARSVGALPVDGANIIDYRGALTLQQVPRSMVIVGSGAIGCEFAWLYATLGAKVTLVELLPRILPTEDGDVSKEMARAFRKRGIEMLTSTSVQSVKTEGGRCVVTVESNGQTRIIEAEKVLSAVGVKSNLEGIGLEEAGVEVERDKVVVDKYYRTTASGIYAIGDIVPGPALAHAAAAEGICCVEAICGLEPEAVDYSTVPACIYTSPEVASVGLRSEDAAQQGIAVKVGTFPFMASGKATATGEREGFVKLIFDATNERLLGAHAVGANVSEIIGELALARRLGATVDTITSTIHCHPTFHEAIAEAAAAAKGMAINI